MRVGSDKAFSRTARRTRCIAGMSALLASRVPRSGVPLNELSGLTGAELIDDKYRSLVMGAEEKNENMHLGAGRNFFAEWLQ